MRDITIKNVPDEIRDEQVMEFVAVLVGRFHDAKVNSIPEVATAIKAAQTGIDSFRVANSLPPKFPAKPVEEPKAG
jgi:hypothetical protein